MKRKEVIMRSFLALCLGVTLVTSEFSVCLAAQTQKNETQTAAEAKETDAEENADAGEDENYLEIKDAKDFLEFAENCKYDSFSIGRTVSLTADIKIDGSHFDGVAYFNGVFDGNGHEITFTDMTVKGSDYGLFRYIGERGVVKNLNVNGAMVPTGTQKNIGGIAGVNYGTIEKCTFRGEVCGIDSVGGIAGKNQGTGVITECSSEALILATNYSGGICGTNVGTIKDCTSKSAVNIEELEATLDLDGIDLGSFNVARRVVNRNDMGGIAGISSGLIADCQNEGTIGYKHTGYNVGGIAGSQKGIVIGCTNKGKVYGRKDVGGIIGQAEPYVESEYLDDKVQQTKDDINRLGRTLNNISATMSSTSDLVKRQAEDLSQQYNDSIDNISWNVDDMNAAVQGNPEAKQYVDQINEAVNNIDSIQISGGELTQEQKDTIQNNLNSINDNLGNLSGTYKDAGQSAEDFTNRITSQLQQNNETKGNRDEKIREMADTIDAGVQSVANNMKSASNQIEHITNSISSDVESLTSEEEIVEDISSLATAEKMDGVISGCTNYGEVHSDINAGGIAGTMNIEYGNDPEFDLRLRDDVDVPLRSTVNGVIIHSVNYGMINVKRDNAGGIAGLQELGFIYDCEGYGPVQSDTGGYLGGITGDSAGTIEKSYSLCNLSGTDYVGGISGRGTSIKDSISISSIESEGERIGSIAGYLEEDGTVRGNIFVSDKLHGVDDISYAGTADKSSYEEVMAMEGIPDGFSRVTIRFEAEDEVLAEKQIAYGGSLTEADLPQAEEEEGCYVEWPGLEDLTDIRENITVTAEYIPWTESIAGSETLENGKNVLLAVGEFYKDTKLGMEAVDGPQNLDPKATAAYAYAWKIEGDREKAFDTVELHLAVPEDAEEASVWMEKDGTWSETEAWSDGSYLVAEIPYGAKVAMVTQPKADHRYLIAAGGAAVVLVLVILLSRRAKKRKNTGNKKAEAK